MSTLVYPTFQPTSSRMLSTLYSEDAGRIGDMQGCPSELSDRGWQIDPLLDSIESPAVREAVQNVFSDLLRLLDCLRFVGSRWLPANESRKALAIFTLIHVDACSVVDSVQQAMQTVGVDKTLYETLDGISFALNHDLQKVFECELKGATDQPNELVIGKLVHGHGMLTNCLQQSTVVLAQVFDPTFSGARFFNNSDARLQESLLLCRDLSDLIRSVLDCEATLDRSARKFIIDRVIRFRDETMQFLMYRDWDEYERFAEEIVLSMGDSQKLAPVLHSFRCYLETLVGQVKLRVVLAADSQDSLRYQVCAHGNGAPDGQNGSTTSHEVSEQRLSVA